MTHGMVSVNYTFKLSDIAIILVTFLGPIFAVQAQKWLEKSRAINDRRNQIFRVLMATRGAMLSPAHVEALNAVPVEFYGSAKRLVEINEKWKQYLDHHSPDIPTNEAWMQKRLDLFVELLYLISQNLGYKFSRSQLARDVYSPKAHGDLESENALIRKGLAQLFAGEMVLPMAVKEFPVAASEESVANQEVIQKLLIEWLRGNGVVKIHQS